MKKSLIGVVFIIIGFAVWSASYGFGSCQAVNGREVCMGMATLRNDWIFYWILALAFVISGIYLIIKKKGN